MEVAASTIERMNARVSAASAAQRAWLPVWQEVSSYFLPRRYPYLTNVGGSLTTSSQTSPTVRNSKLLDSTSTWALRTLATGMMNGITSPARPWFRLKIKGRKYTEHSDVAKQHLEECTRIMLGRMASTNFYGAIGILYTELAAFGTASLDIYEDYQSTFRCRNYPLGSFMIENDPDGRVRRHIRRFRLTHEDVLATFGPDGMTKEQRDRAKSTTVSERRQMLLIACMIEPNDDQEPKLSSGPFRRLYWIEGNTDRLLEAKPVDRLPLTPRWETYADDPYGFSPCMEATPDVISLQHLTRRKAQGLDKVVSPPILAHTSLANKAKAFIPDSVTYVPSADLQQGARPLLQINVPFQELALDIQALQARIKMVLFNDLFRMIADLDTVRSATEIDARREEKLVLLGPVLERFDTEALSPAIEAIFSICLEAGLFPEPPADLEAGEIEVEYSSIMSDAQRAVGTIPTERWLQLIGNVSQFYPQSVNIVEWEELIRGYAEDIGVSQNYLRPREESEADTAAQAEMQSLEQAAGIGTQLAKGAQALAATQVGGGLAAAVQ